MGDEEKVDSTGSFHYTPASPSLAMSMFLKIANFQIFYPRRRDIEKKMVDAIGSLLKLKDQSDVKVVDRVLKIGLLLFVMTIQYVMFYQE